jgi:geranylgeranyl pyrophosphate synthase
MKAGAAPGEIERRTPSLATIQGLVHDVLDGVIAHMSRVLEADVPFINEISFHLQQMRGKLFRPVLLSLCNRIEEDPDEREISLGSVIEIIHLASLVHDDTIDESALRRGMPTLNSKWDHKVSVIMGPYFPERCPRSRLGDLELIALAQSDERSTIGEMAEMPITKLVEDPAQYFYLIEKKTAKPGRHRLRDGRGDRGPRHRDMLAAYGTVWGWRSSSSTT